MKQYIDKDALVAEIEKRLNFNEKLNAYSRVDECNAILSFLDTLEVKEVQEEHVNEDLEEAATKYARKQVANPDYPTYNDEYEMVCAFEAGAQWQKEQLMDKACEWLNTFYNEETHSYLIDEDIKKFKNYMKGE